MNPKKLTKTLLTTALTLCLTLTLFTACTEKPETDTPDNPGGAEVTEPGNSSTPADLEGLQPGDNPLPTPPPGIDNTGNNYAVITVRDYGSITVQLHPEYAPVAVSRFSENARAGFYDGKDIYRIVADFMLQGGSYDGQGMPPLNTEGFQPETHIDMRHYYGALSMAANYNGDATDAFYIVNSKNTDAFAELQESISAIASNVMATSAEIQDIEENWAEYTADYGFETMDYYLKRAQNGYRHYTNLLNYTQNASEQVKATYAESGGAPFLDGGYTVFGHALDGFDVIDKISAVQVVDNGYGEVSSPTVEVIIESVVIYSERPN
ncbi:MAG: peptidylprolyl isomerase [Oscillospiraceae bacterium]|nr:peptidylprolyl isomerase [Oscillospiraceae bacterium]